MEEIRDEVFTTYNELFDMVNKMSFDKAYKELNGFDLQADAYYDEHNKKCVADLKFQVKYKNIETTIFMCGNNECELWESAVYKIDDKNEIVFDIVAHRYINTYSIIVNHDVIVLENWEEKKKELKKVEPTPIFRVGDTLRRKCKDYTFVVDRIQGGYYHCDHSNGAFFPIEEQDNWELVEQKPAEWSEEDERKLGESISLIKSNNTGTFYYEKNELISFLKSLKDRVQPKQEWSEEDKRIMQGIESIIRHYRDEGESVCPYPFVTIEKALAWIIEKQ